MFLRKRLKALDDKIQSIIEEVRNEKRQQEDHTSFIPKVKQVLEVYYTTSNVEMKNKLLKTVIDKAFFTRKVEWNKRDQFIIHLDTKI